MLVSMQVAVAENLEQGHIETDDYFSPDARWSWGSSATFYGEERSLVLPPLQSPMSTKKWMNGEKKAMSMVSFRKPSAHRRRLLEAAVDSSGDLLILDMDL